jgi:glycosyltransferase involved in cell wall biosynthesis
MADAIVREAALMALVEVTPAVSAVIIFYNAEQFLEDAIRSVFSQTEPDWELLLVDDGSTDRSTGIAREYTHLHPEKVRYFEHLGHQNRGMSASRNLGIHNCRGPWIAFLDADDVWEPDKLSQQRNILGLHPEAGFLYGSPLYWFSWSPQLANFRDCQPGLSVAPESLVYPPDLMLRTYPLGSGPAPVPSDVIVSRLVAEQVGGFEESFGGIYQMYEDQAFLAKVYLSTPAYISGRCWTRYRQHPNACSTVVRDSGCYREVRRLFLEFLQQYLLEKRVEHPAIWNALRRAWWPYHHPYLWLACDLLRRVWRRLRRDFAATSVGQFFAARTKITTS